jgi:DNA-binding XRE family transcriptional regulator
LRPRFLPLIPILGIAIIQLGYLPSIFFLELFFNRVMDGEMPKAHTEPQQGPARERAIGRRLHEVREFLSYSQSEFASELGIKKVRLSSYESGRVPIRWEIALEICRKFLVSEHWLATGGGRAMGIPGKRLRFGNSIVRASMIHPNNPILKTLPAGLQFSAAYDLALLREYWRRAGESARTFTPLDFSDTDSPERLRSQMEWTLALWRSILPKQLWGTYCVALMKCGALVFDSLLLHAERVTDKPTAALAIEAWLDRELERTGLTGNKKGNLLTENNR